jgi:hypothetical protein
VPLAAGCGGALNGPGGGSGGDQGGSGVAGARGPTPGTGGFGTGSAGFPGGSFDAGGGFGGGAGGPGGTAGDAGSSCSATFSGAFSQTIGCMVTIGDPGSNINQFSVTFFGGPLVGTPYAWSLNGRHGPRDARPEPNRSLLTGEHRAILNADLFVSS